MSLNFGLFDFLFPSFLDGSDSKGYACNAEDPGLILGQKDLLQKEMATHSSILS